jgi:SAM-dependent methyltransferase
MTSLDQDRLHEAERELRRRLDRWGNWFQRLQFSYKSNVIRQSALLSYISPAGTVVDVGCGTGIVSCLLALALPDKRVIGVDTDRRRLAWCSRLASGIPNVTFLRADIQHYTFPPIQEAICLDVLHHLPPIAQDRLVFSIVAHLQSGGRFILFEVDKNPNQKWKYWMSLLVDYLLYPFQEKANFRQADVVLDLFRRAGLEPETVQPLSSPIVAPILYVGRRVATKDA